MSTNLVRGWWFQVQSSSGSPADRGTAHVIQDRTNAILQDVGREVRRVQPEYAMADLLQLGVKSFSCFDYVMPGLPGDRRGGRLFFRHSPGKICALYGSTAPLQKEMRCLFLENVPVPREIVREWERSRPGSKVRKRAPS